MMPVFILAKNGIVAGRFTPCASGLGLLITSAEAARRAMAGRVFVSPAGLEFCDDFGPTPMNEINLTCRGICRGKISLQKKSTNLEERTQSAPNQ